MPGPHIYTPPAPRNTHVTLAMPQTWDHEGGPHSGHTSLITPCFHAYIRAPFMAIYDCPYLGSRLEMVQWSRVGKGSTTAPHTTHPAPASGQHCVHWLCPFFPAMARFRNTKIKQNKTRQNVVLVSGLDPSESATTNSMPLKCRERLQEVS